MLKKTMVLLAAACLMAGTVYGLFGMKIIPLRKGGKPAAAAAGTSKAPSPQRAAEATPEPPPTQPSEGGVSVASAPAGPPPLASTAPSGRSEMPAEERKRIDRLASVYEQMQPADAAKILSRLPDPLVEQMLRTMDERQVGKILTTMPTTRAARLTISLSR